VRLFDARICPVSDRERGEGFHLTGIAAVAALSAVAVAVSSAVDITASERVEGFTSLQ